jgi:hypothetical protein
VRNIVISRKTDLIGRDVEDGDMLSYRFCIYPSGACERTLNRRMELCWPHNRLLYGLNLAGERGIALKRTGTHALIVDLRPWVSLRWF